MNLRMNAKLVATIVLVSVSASGAMAADAAKVCLDQGRYGKLMQEYKWSAQRNAKGVAVTGADPCNEKSVSYKVFAAYMKMQDFPKFDSRTDEANRNFIGTAPAEFVKARVKAFVFEAEDSKVCVTGQVAAYVQAGQNIAHICPQAVESSDLDVMDTLVHESRHVEGYPHAQCTRGDRANADFLACDESYDKGGSYGIGAEFQVRLSRTEGVAPAIRAQARALGLMAFMTSFNKLPLDLQEGVFAQTKEHQLYFVGETTTTMVSKQIPEGVLVSRGGMPTWFNGNTGEVLSRGAGDVMTDTDGMFAKQFRTEIAPEKRKAFVDIKYGTFTCMLFETEMSCTPDLTEAWVIALEGQKPSGFITIGSRSALRMEDGTVYGLPDDFAAIKGKKLNQLPKAQLGTELVHYVSASSKAATAMTKDGLLVGTKDSKTRMTAIEHSKNLRFERMIGPAMWSLKSEKL